MKNTLLVILLIITMGSLCQLFADPVVINSFPHQESFEGAEYPPTGWELRQNWGDPSIELVTNDSENPTAYDTPYGDNYVRLPIKPDAPNNWAALVSPRIDFPEGDGYYRLKVSIYITGTTHSNVLIERMTQSWNGDSYQIGYMHNDRYDTPVGWYEYSFSLGFVGGTSQYIALSAYCLQEDINIDNITIEEGSPWNLRAPGDGYTNVEVNPMVYWSDYFVETNTYSVYFSTDAINYSLVYEGVFYGKNFNDDPLLSDTTYYWYIVANEYGHEVTSPVWTFTTIEDYTPNYEDAILSYPYLADFQVDDPLWVSFSMVKDADKGTTNLLEPGTSLLQERESNMSKDEDMWVRVLDGEANYAYKLQSGLSCALLGPYYYLTAGQTYQVKYNYRQSEYTEPSEDAGIVMISDRESLSSLPDINVNMTNTDYALRVVTVTPEYTDYYLIGIMGFSTVDMYIDNFRITQNGDDLLTAAAPTVDGVATPDPSPIYNTETLLPLDTDLHIANISGTPEITATVSWTAPELGSQNTGLKLNLNSSAGNLAGATVTFIHNLGYAPLSVSYRIVPNAFSTMNNPNDGSWTASQCVFTVPAGKADGDYEVILQLNEEQTLPVELSSFTAIATQQNYVQLNWVTQSESGLSGYYIYRSNTNSLESAQIVSSLISAYNSSQQHAYTFTDEEVQTGSWYYWLQSMELDGQIGFHGSIHVEIQETGDGGTPEIPLITSLQKVYPNPFNPSTTIAFGLAKAENVNIQIYNLKGQLIRNLVSGIKQADSYRIVWNGTDDNGKPLSSGIYYARMTAGNYTATQKLVIMK